VESIKVPSPKCPKCGSENVFVSRTSIICDACGNPNVATSDFMKRQKTEKLKLLLEEVGENYDDETVECL